ncbi:coiled-coil domain-containing protein 34-like isoform X1 [Teleopsis dalmanni]|uniref:coiled-coil domain-containing protein 34-like isoform X1 n=1 Tax=Teleopsis dalmanni TaxID=139649 RepID=UPI0018CE862E|nr:coiled-coil domain-containing protein 34-like isoform X1 [Teleopsis dalmanni]
MEDNDIVSSLEITINPISRFVNSAAYIKNILEPTSTNKKEVNSLLNMEEKDIIPPLKIPTNRQLSSTALRYDRDSNKIYGDARNPELAYTQWLEQKNKLLTDRTIKQKQLEEEKRKRKELQNSVSATKVQEWFNKKKHAHALKKIQESRNLLTDISKKENIILKAMQSKIKFLEWECNKEREEKQKRLLKQIEINKQRNEIEERKQKATEAWEAWITKAAKKPKPVPLNRGLDSLRGAVSHSYVNPNQWQT